MSLTMLVPQEANSATQLNIPDGARILIACDDGAEGIRLKLLLREAGFMADSVDRITAACESARSGEYQLIISTPQLSDGSWKRLADIAKHFDLHFEVILWARHFDLAEWSEALNQGAFDVLDALFDRTRIAGVAKCALWAAYLRGARTKATLAPLPNKVA